jgi:NAD(P)-dependent dehydrogenase (short-subunit alcohol dehydrogenase family)
VRRLADQVLQRCARIDVLVNNVGGYWDSRHLTTDGLERTAAHAMTALQEDGDLAVAMVVGQVRSTVLDLLLCSGMELADAQQALDEAAGPAVEGA